MLEKNCIIFVKEKKGYTGFFKNRPNVIAEGDTKKKMVENLTTLLKAVNKYQAKQKKEKK